jgi:hypothetical protein
VTLTELEAAVEEAVAHPDAPVVASFPGLGTQLAARMLAETGDDKTRFAGSRALKAFAGAALVTRASGKSRFVRARRARNDRMAAARYAWALAAIRHDPLWEGGPLPRPPHRRGPARGRTAETVQHHARQTAPHCWPPLGKGHRQSVFHEAGAHVIRQGPAHHTAAGQIDDRREGSPSLPGHDVGDVTGIVPVRARPRRGVRDGQRVERVGLARLAARAGTRPSAGRETGPPRTPRSAGPAPADG